METIQKTLTALPHEPGVYIYKDKSSRILYVGKAIDLARRVKSYFQKNTGIAPKIAQLVSEIVSIETITTTSEFEALLLEAKLIRDNSPKYNSIAKDDKSPLYIALTIGEELPRVLFLRRTQLALFSKDKKTVVFGPFQSAKTVRAILRQLRSVVPYCTQKQRTGKRCFYTHLGLCNPCPSEIVGMVGSNRNMSKKLYRSNIFRLKSLFEGKFGSVRSQYEMTMQEHAKNLAFEKANDIKKRLDALYALSMHHYDPMTFLERGASDLYDEELDDLKIILKTWYPELSTLSRIECFDMSQLYGDDAVGSMVVLTDGKPDTKEYRRFKIKNPKDQSDTGFMTEVLMRRFKRADWKFPDFLLVDGGKSQVRAAQTIMHTYSLKIPIGGLAKRREELIIPTDSSFKTIHLPITGGAIKILQRIRDEAHRFAISYHRLLRQKKFAADRPDTLD